MSNSMRELGGLVDNLYISSQQKNRHPQDLPGMMASKNRQDATSTPSRARKIKVWRRSSIRAGRVIGSKVFGHNLRSVSEERRAQGEETPLAVRAHTLVVGQEAVIHTQKMQLPTLLLFPNAVAHQVLLRNSVADRYPRETTVKQQEELAPFVGFPRTCVREQADQK